MDKREMLDAIVAYFTHGNKAKFATMLGVSAQTISAWGTRNTFDTELIYTKCIGISAEWLLTGEGPMLREERSKGIIHEDPQVPTPKPDESILYNMYKDLMEEKKEKEKKIEQLTNELRAMERKVGTLEAELKHTATLGNRTAEPVSTAKRSSQSKAFATFVSAPSNEYESR